MVLGHVNGDAVPRSGDKLFDEARKMEGYERDTHPFNTASKNHLIESIQMHGQTFILSLT